MFKVLNILKKLNDLELNLSNGIAYGNICKSVYPDKEIRDACKESVADLNKLSIELKLDTLNILIIIIIYIG